MMPGWVGIVVPWVLAVAVSTLLAGRSLSVWRLAIAVAASQFLFHGLFVLGLFGQNASATPPHMSVRAPLIAPRLPPDTGATMNAMPRSRPAAESSSRE